MMLLTVRMQGPYYTNSGYLPCMRAWPIELHNRVRTDDTLVPNSLNKKNFLFILFP